MKKISSIFIYFLAVTTLFALPEKKEVVAGHADFHSSNKTSLKITTSDKAIINYQKFNISELESVQFVQPSAKSTILNRITGKDPSKILGKLSSNGQVFLVNPNGIYFGPSAIVNAGSFLASTLNIQDEDFLNDRFNFFKEDASKNTGIVNEGMIASSPEGFIALISPFIENRGSILARAGKIVLAAAERVTLDFSGDGLIQFTVDGDLEKSLIENYGKIEAASGSVKLLLRTAKNAIKMVVNTDGITPVNAMEESNGVIRLVCNSYITADKVHIEGSGGSRVDAQGTINASNKIDEKGGLVHVLGDVINLNGAQVHASGDKGGGEVLIGGDYQGKGDLLKANFTFMDSDSVICANANQVGDGGKVILWSEDTTLFDGKIFACGGKSYGDGGFVETSGKNELGIEQGFVDTSAPYGKFGEWLLDPRIITISTSGSATIAQCSPPNCASNQPRTIAASTIAASLSNVTLCAQRDASSSIVVDAAVTMSNPGISLSLTAGSTNIGAINLNNNITTRGGAISLVGVVTLGANVTLDTTNAGATPAGANINFSNTINGATALTLRAGSAGNVIFSGAVGGVNALTNLSFTSTNLIQLGNNITVSGANPLIFPSPVSLTGASTITSNNASVAFNSTINGSQALTVAAGTGGATFTGVVGGSTPLISLSATGSLAINVNSNITTNGGAIILTGPTTVLATSFNTTNSGGTPTGANIIINGTLNGASALNLNGGTAGAVSISGAIGGITPLTSLTTIGVTTTQGSSAVISGALSYTGPTGVSVGGSIRTNGAIIGVTGPLSISNNPIFDTTNAGGTPAGANVNFSNTINGATALALRAGSAGNVIFTGAVGGTTPLTNLSFTSTNLIQLGNNITVSGANPLIFPSPISLTGLSNITSNNANITFNSTIDSNAPLTRTLRLIAGNGNVVLTGAIGGTNAIGTFGITSANNVTANGITVGTMSQSAGTGSTVFNGAIATSNSLGINLTGSAFTFNNTVTTTSGGGLLIANSGLLSMPNGSTFTLSGLFSQSGTGNVECGNSITSNGNISLSSAVSLTNNALFSTAASSQVITLMSTINSLSTTPFDLTLDAGSNNIFILGNVGSIHPLGAFLINSANNITVQGLVANSATISSGTGTATINGNIAIGSGGISLNGNNVVNNGNLLTTDGGSVVINNSGTVTRSPGNTTVVDGDYSIIGTGPAFAGSLLEVHGNILINPAVTLVADAVINTSIGGGNITFSSTINATRALTIMAGTGDISIGGNVGSLVPIGRLVISSANNVTTQDIVATSIAQTAGTGTTIFNGNLSTSGVLGISINTNNITRGAAIITTGAGPLTVTNSGTFTSTAAGEITLGGAFTQNGTGAVSLGGSIITANAGISFSGPITLAANVSLNTGTGAGDITISQSVQGAFTLTLNSGTGNITLAGGIGTVTPLSGFTITRAANVSTQGLSSSFISQLAGTGLTTFNGALNTTALAGISLTGTAFTFNNLFTTTGGGNVAITNSGLVTFASGATGTISGTLIQAGSGSLQLSSSIVSAGEMQFNGAFTVSGSGSLSTEAANQPITFFNILDGPGDLTLSTGTGDILIVGNAGGVSPLGDLVISTALNVSTHAITASSITQLAGGGTTLFSDNLTTSGVGGIDLTGSVFTFIENATANGGSIAIANSGTLTSFAGKTLSGDGGFAQTGAGVVSLGSVISASDADISFASAITLTSNVILNSGTTAGDITVDTVDGHFNLTFTAGRDITAGVIGGTTRLATVTATTVRNNNASSITAEGIIQLAGSGTTTLNGNVNTNTPAGINLMGTNFVRSGSIITTNGGSFVVTNSGSITGTSINTTSIDGSYTQIGIGPSDSSNLAGTITARLGISLSSPTTLVSDPLNITPIILDSSGGNGNITVTGTINNDAFAPHTLILRSGSGNVTVSSSIGSTAEIGPLTLGNVNDISALAITADSIQQEALTTISGQASFNGIVTTSGVSGIVLAGNDISFSDNVITTGAGDVALTNSGLLTIASGSSFTLDGPFSQSGAGSVSFGGSISTTNDAISFASPITLTNSVSLDSGVGVGNITLNASLDGAFSINLDAGTGNITFQDTIGQVTPLTGVSVQSAADVLVDAPASLSGPFTITSSTGTTTFNETLEASAINLSGAIINFNNAITTTSGSIVIINSGTLTTSSTASIISGTTFSQSGAGSVSLGSNITTSGTLSIASPITLTNGINLNSGGGDMTLSDTVSGVFDLNLTAGTGDIALLGNIGAPRIGAFTITSANDILAQSITAASLALLSSTGTSTLTGSLDSDTAVGITLIGNNFTTSGSITTTNGGSLVVTNSGLVTATGASTIVLNGGGSFTQNGTGSVNLGGTLTTQNANISHSSPVSVLLPATFTSNGGNIIFQNTVDGPDCLTLAAGAGDVTFNGIVGGTTPLGCLDVAAANIFQNQSIQAAGFVQMSGTTAIFLSSDITTNASDITLTGDVTVDSSLTLSTGVGVGDILVSGTVNGNAAGHDLTIEAGTGDVTVSSTLGGNNSFNNLIISGENVTWANFGSAIVGATGLTTVSATVDLNFSETSYNSGTQVYTAGGNFNFTAVVPTSVTSSMSAITFNTGTVQLATTDLTINSNGGDITLTPLLGTGRNLTVNADVGSFTFVQIGAFGSDLNNVILTSNNFTPTPILNGNVFAGSLSVNSSIPQIISTDQLSGNITFNSPIIIQGNITYTCGGAGTITFNNRVDADVAGVDSLTFNLNPCAASIVFNAPVGAVAPLASISADTVTNITTNSTMNVGEFLVTNGVGTTSINSGITTTAAGGISISTPIINIAGPLTTASTGPVVLDNSGALTVSIGSSFNVSGAFQQTGAGSVSIGSNILTDDANIEFTGPVTLSGSTTLTSTQLTGGDISFASTIEGAQNLTLAAGTGNISFNADVGTLITPLVDLRINSAQNLTASAPIFALSVMQLAGTGSTNFDAITTSGLNGINVVGNDFTFNGNITTSSSGPLIIDNSGDLTFTNSVYSIAGALTQSGVGANAIAGTFTVGGAVSFTEAITLTDTTNFDTSANSLNITFGSEITNDLLGSHDLTLSAGGGTITCSGDIGAMPIGAFTITNAGNANFNSISATSMTQSAGSGITTIASGIATSALAGISLTGNVFTISGNVITTSAGPFLITNSGSSSLTLGSGTLVDGSFLQSGGGAISFSGTLATNNQNLSFTNALTLTGTSSFSTGDIAGDITLSAAVNGNNALTLTAGTGNIVFGSTIGGIAPLASLVVSSVNNVTYPQIKAGSVIQSGSTGTTTISGSINTTALLGVSITGSIINQNGAITTTNSGSVSFINSNTLTVGIGVSTSSNGAYLQSGGGSVSLGGSIASVNNPISFTGPVALTGAVGLTAGPGISNANDISFASAVTGSQALSLTAEGGSITFSADVGTLVTPLTSFNVINANIVSTQGVFADFITQLVGSGSTTFNGPLNASSISGISLIGTIFVFDDTVTSSGPMILANSGLATFNAGAASAISGVFTQNGLGGVQLSSSITAGGEISFLGALTLVGTGSLDTQVANQPITFLNTVNGPGNLSLSSGSEDILFSKNVGATTRLGSLSIITVNNLTALEIRAGSIQQSAGTGLSIFNGELNTDAVGGIDLTGTTFTFVENVTTTGSGPISINNSSTLTTTIGKTFSSDGVFTQNGSGGVLFASAVTTTNASAANADINFTGSSPIILIAPVSIDSSTGGGTINFSAASTINGNQSMVLTAGTGDINILGTLGGITPIGAFTVESVNDLQVQSITANSITQLAGTGTSNLLGSLAANTPAGISLIGNNFAIGPAALSIITTNGGSFTVTNQGLISAVAPIIINIDGSFIQNGPGAVLFGSITARLGISFAGPSVLLASATLNTSSGNGDIVFANIISALAGTEGLVLNAGTGNISFSQPIGLNTVIDVFPVTSLGSLTVAGETLSFGNIGDVISIGVSGSTDLTASADIIFTGTNYHANTQNYTTAFSFQMSAGSLTTFLSNGNPLTFQGGEIELSSSTDLTINTAGANLSLQRVLAQSGDLRSLILNTGTASIEVGDIGTQGNGEFALASFTSSDLTLGHAYAGSFNFNYTGTLNALGNIASTDTDLSFPNPVVLQTSNVFSTVGTIGADITFSGLLDGAIADTYGLALNAGTGDIDFLDDVGSVNRLLSLTIASVNNVTLASPETMSVDALIQSSGFGTTTFNGPLIVPGVIGILLTGNNFTFNSSVTTLNNASLTVANSGTLTFAGVANLSGAFTQSTSSGPVALSGSITAGQPITFAGPVTLSGSTSLDTSSANQLILFSNTLDGSGDITFAAGSEGIITFQENVGSITRLGAITINSCHNVTAQSVSAESLLLVSSLGLATVNGTLSTSGAAGVDITGNNFILNGALLTTGGGSVVVTNSGLITGISSSSHVVDGSYTQNGTGPVNFAGSLTTNNGPISFTSDLTLLGSSVFDSSAAGQNITFSSTIDGSSSLLVIAGAGDVSFAQDIGIDVALSSFTVSSANDITLNSVGTTASGVTGAMSLNASNDINLQSDTYSATSQTYSAPGGINFNAGSLTNLISFGESIAFTSGVINLSNGNDLQIITNNGGFSFVSLLGTNSEGVVINAGSGVVNLNAVSSPGSITELIVDAGRITLSGPIEADRINFVSLSSILNSSAAVLIQSPNTMELNALGGNVGTLSSPILVQSSDSVFAGAGGDPKSLAIFDGATSDNTIHQISFNPPCIIIFNGVVIQDCGFVPIPSGSTITSEAVFSSLPYPEVYSSYFNLASNFYFLSYFFYERYVQRDVIIDWKP